MNGLEGVETGKWLVKEIGHLQFEAVCPVCGYRIPVLIDHDVMTFRYQLYGLRETCPRCNENMFKQEPKLFTEEAAFIGSRLEPSSKSLVINCDKITLEQRSLGITVDISESIDNIDTVEINGVKFVREV
jgi:rRNA maturation protein Nop10